MDVPLPRDFTEARAQARDAEARVAIVRTLAALVGGAVVFASPGRPDWNLGAFSALYAFAVLSNLGIVWLIRHRRWTPALSAAASVADVLALTVGCALLGGVHSILRGFYFLVPISAALRYPPPRTLLLTGLAALGWWSVFRFGPAAPVDLVPTVAFLLELGVTGVAAAVLGAGVIRSREVMEARVAARTRELDGRTRQLEQANVRLSELDRLKDEFLGILSHELRTPIHAITGFGSALEDGVLGPLTEDQQAAVRKMLGGADVLLALVEDLLDLTRIQAGKFQLERRATRFGGVVEEALAILETLATAKRVTLRAEVPPDLPVLDADARRLGQVLLNLGGNAVKFTPAGGQVVVRVALTHDRVRCEVEDTGVGIAAEDLGRLFQPFSQLDTSPTRPAGGAGLGLSIAKALVEAHGGRIGVESVPGRGSTFWFELPAPAAAGV